MNKINKFLTKIFMAKRISPMRIIVLGFSAVIFMGAVLLTLPVSSADGERTNFLHCIFTAASATCVTGLVIYDTFTHWSFFGQAIILIMIQTGGLGFMTIIAVFMFTARFRIGIKSKLMIMRNFGLESMQGITGFVKRVTGFTFFIEIAGAIILSFVYIPSLGARGIWQSIFHSVSAFCNAGFDLNGYIEPGISVRCFYDNSLVLITLAGLIIIGGIGFFVWDALFIRSAKKVSLYAKIVIIMTAFLVVSGTVLFCAIEWNNPYTLGGLTVSQKVVNAFFQAVTLRTAGFESIMQARLTETGKIISVLYMFIGGSAGSTAGGVKTATVFVIILALISALKGERDTILFRHRISHTRVISAFAVVLLAVLIDVFGSIFISAAQKLSFIDCLYETVSAYATVGLTVGVTADLSDVSLILYIIYMFMGRVGVTTIGIGILTGSHKKSELKYPEADIIIG